MATTPSNIIRKISGRFSFESNIIWKNGIITSSSQICYAKLHHNILNPTNEISIESRVKEYVIICEYFHHQTLSITLWEYSRYYPKHQH